MDQDSNLKQIYSCEDFTIVEKPSGLSCHNAADSVLSRLGSGFHLVHRLDKDTSGLLMVTLKPELQERLQLAMQAGEKEYLAVLRGVIEVTSEWQVWDAPISDAAESRTNPQGVAGERITARTLYRAEKNSPYFSLVHCLLQSGRQHQIRKHAAIAGRPIVGDSRYGNPKDNERILNRYGFSRLALHAHRLSFKWNLQDFAVVSPLPAEFERFFA